MDAPASGDSMAPLIKTGVRLRLSTDPRQRYETGDIIVFLKNKTVMAHRIINIQKTAQGSRYRVKGDNNPMADGFIRDSQIVGKVGQVIAPTYALELSSANGRAIKRFFVWYSRANEIFPALRQVVKLGNYWLLKAVYRWLIGYHVA